MPSEGILLKGGGGGVSSDELTSQASNVLAGDTYVGKDTDDEIGVGTMKNNTGATKATSASVDSTNKRVQFAIPERALYDTNAKVYVDFATLANILGVEQDKMLVTKSILGVQGTIPVHGAVSPNALGAGESYTIPEGHHNGKGKVTVKSLAELTASGTLSNGNQMLKDVKAISDGTLYTGTIESMAGGTHKSGTTNKTISCKGKYMTSDIVIEGDSDLVASKIAKGANILGVTGTHYGNKKAIGGSVVYCSRFDSNLSEDMNYEESFTLPSDGIVYYGGFSALYYTSGKCTCEIYKNGTLMDSRNINSDNAFRGTMFNKSFAVSKGDVVKVKCTATSGNLAVAGIQAVIVY